MKATQAKAADELRMSSKEFDRMMGLALKAPPSPAVRKAKPRRAKKRKARSSK